MFNNKNKKMTREIKIGTLVKSKKDDNFTTWEVKEINIGYSGKKWYTCEARHDTKLNYGFDNITRDFNEKEIELY
tara:strand:+ start:717 stop:941 length:225 start_codon:yes stop_codon:yes gene_type:complete